jgi:hypothetical protein
MKLTTIALAGAFALSSSFALAQGTGGTSGRDNRHVVGLPDRAEHHHEPLRQHAGAQRLAQRIDVNADRTRFRHRPLSDR